MNPQGPLSIYSIFSLSIVSDIYFSRAIVASQFFLSIISPVPCERVQHPGPSAAGDDEVVVVAVGVAVHHPRVGEGEGQGWEHKAICLFGKLGTSYTLLLPEASPLTVKL